MFRTEYQLWVQSIIPLPSALGSSTIDCGRTTVLSSATTIWPLANDHIL